MSLDQDSMEAQLRRQLQWLEESWKWLLQTKILDDLQIGHRPSALDVGCGPGYVMEKLSFMLDVQGIDLDPRMVESCRSRRLPCMLSDAEDMPFDDGSFDIVYCSFLLLWVKDPVAVIREMCRVSRRYVVCLAEPDYGGRIDHPDALSVLGRLAIDDIEKRGGDPFIGRKLRGIFHRAGLDAEIGVHPGVWSMRQMEKESEDEWNWLRSTFGSSPELVKAEESWYSALHAGTLFQYNPIFYSIARRG